MGDRNGDEETLVRAAQHGETAAFTALVERYQQQIGGYLYRLVGDRQTAEDLTQETFMRAYRALATARAVDAFRAGSSASRRISRGTISADSAGFAGSVSIATVWNSRASRSLR